MGYKSVEILDVRSMSVTAAIGSAGVNNTFVIRGSQTQAYDGYEDGRFYSSDDLKRAVTAALEATEKSASEHLKTVYVSVPGEFTKIINKRHMIGFTSPKRISEGDIATLYRDGYGSIEEPEYENTHSSALYFITSDSRKVSDPTGIVSSTLQANICYILSACYYCSLLREILTGYGFKAVCFVPASYAQGVYLLSEDRRNAGAVLLDVGMLSSTVSVVYGDGILREQTFWVGEGQIAAQLCEAFEIGYEDATALLRQANLFLDGSAEVRLNEETSFPSEAVNETIKYALDMLCEPLSQFLEGGPPFVDKRPILLTGEGITGLRGASEHISKRLSAEIETVAPGLPYYNKPSMSSRISLLDYAAKERGKEGLFRRIKKAFGG